MTIPKQSGSRSGQPPGHADAGAPPARPRRTWLFVVLAAVAVVAGGVGVVLTTGGGGPGPDNPTPSIASPTSSGTPDSSVPDGEIWQWALGRNLWTDPGLEAYAKDLGTDWSDPGTDANAHSQGFQLTADSTGTVTAVTLYNDESALGYPGADSNFSAYQGALPMGLTWNDTAADLGAIYGAQNQSGGYGTDIVFAYRTSDGHRIEVSFVARHEQDLPGSVIHSITVTS